MGPATIARSVDILTAGVDEYERRSTELAVAIGGQEGAAVATTSARLVLELEQFISALSTVPTPGEPRVESLDDAPYQAAVGTLVAVRDDRVQDVLVEAEYAGQVADGLRFLVTIAVPITAMLLLRSIMRRRRERDSMRGELER